jgi:hypothetical protein
MHRDGDLVVGRDPPATTGSLSPLTVTVILSSIAIDTSATKRNTAGPRAMPSWH